MALNLISRFLKLLFSICSFNGDASQARLFFDSTMSGDAERTSWKIEDVHGNEARQDIHYQIVAFSFGFDAVKSLRARRNR